VTVTPGTASTKTVGTGTSVTIDVSCGSVGDLIVAAVTTYFGSGAATSFAALAGWTLQGSAADVAASDSATLAVYTRVKQTGDPTSITVTASRSCDWMSFAVPYAGAASAAGGATSYTKTTHASPVAVGPNIVIGSGSGVPVTVAGSYYKDTWSGATGGTIRAQIADTGKQTSMALADAGEKAAGTYSISITQSGTGTPLEFGAVGFYIVPAAAPSTQNPDDLGTGVLKTIGGKTLKSLIGAVTPPVSHPYFQAASWMWDKIPGSPVIDAASATIVASLADTGKGKILNMWEYGVAVAVADESTPRYAITFTAGWGNPFGTTTMPIPAGLTVPPGSDGHVVVIDPTTDKVFSLWQADFSGATKKASFGSMVALDGDGRETSGSSTGAGLARLAGIVRLSEMAAGVIPHALFFSTDVAKSTTFRYPATKTDGGSTANLIEEGTRIQLDPSIDLSTIPGITAGEQIIGKALQDYGAYCGDNGGSRAAFIAEKEPSGSSPGATYTAKGFAWDYYSMSHLPWAGLRVLASWDGS